MGRILDNRASGPAVQVGPRCPGLQIETLSTARRGAGAFVAERGLCHHLPMAKTVIVKLTDDIDGGDADETVHFALDGKTYEIDLSAANASALREAFKPFIEGGRA